MTFPLFPAQDDPGPDFAALVRRAGLDPPQLDRHGDAVVLTHGTTVVALRYADGVIMAGDRRATAGNLISHRHMDKVFPADRHSGVAIAGAAGPGGRDGQDVPAPARALREGRGRVSSRLEGKANQLSMMVRSNLPAAMQGLAVVPLFAGYDLGRETGRLFEFDVTGGRYEENDHASTGSGSLHAGTVVKLGWKPDLTREEAVDLALKALFQAADEDSATGGPDLVRGIYPTMATITAEGFTALERDEIAERFRALLDSMDGGLAS